jgi:hypothetical protein
MASRKDYNALAEVISEIQCLHNAHGIREIIAVKMAKVYATDNERFDEQRFYEACDINIAFAVQRTTFYDDQLQGEVEVTA